MSNRSFRSLGLALGLLAAAGPAFAESYRIGVPVPLSGARRSRGEAIVGALRMKADHLNQTGGVNGHSIELVVLDDQDTPEGARKAAATLAADKRILAVIGHYDIEPAQAAVPVYAENKIPVFLPSVGNQDVLAHSPWIFGGTYADAAQVQTMAAFIKAARHHDSVLVLNNGGEYGRDLWRAFSVKAARVGLKARNLEYPSGHGDGDAIPADFIAKNLPVVPAGVQAIVIFGYSGNAAALIKQLRGRGIHLPVYGSSRVGVGDVIARLGGETEDVHAAFPFMFDFGSEEAINFRYEYLKRHGTEPSVYGLFAYDGLGAIAKAIIAKGPDRAAIRDFLGGLKSEATAFDGAAGLLYFDKDGAAVREPLMGTITDGEFHPCFVQLRLVTEKHTLDNLPEKVKAGEVLVVDGTPFFKINVVYSGIEYYRINQVNVKDLNFEAEFVLWLKWSGDVDVENVQFLNEVPGKGYRIEMRRATVPAAGHGGDDVKWISYRYKGTFLQPYDLRHFPFDRQELPLMLAHKNKNANKIELAVDAGNIVEKPLKEIYPQEWNYRGRRDYAATFRYASAFGNPTYRRGERQAPYSVYRSSLRIRRLLFPYLVTLFLPLSMLIAVSLLVLLIPKEQFAPRNGLVMSSLLGVLVYHMAQARSLPQVGYLMVSDLYFVVAYFMLAALVLGLNIINLLLARKKDAEAERLDFLLKRGFLAGTLLAYTALTVFAMAGRK